MELKDKLKNKRVEAGYTQKELAEILHVSRQTISSWEVGRTYPDLEVLVAISELYETPLDDLLKEDSKMVENITKKVKQSERRKITNIVLAILLIITVGYGVFSSAQQYQKSIQNSLVNEEGLSPKDLLNSAWQMNYDPNKELQTSILSIDEGDMVMLNQYSSILGGLITPYMTPDKIQKMREEWEEKGLADGLNDYKDLIITVDGNKYILTAYGYRQEFTKLSDTIIRDENGIEYYELPGGAMHEALYGLAENMDVPIN